VGIVGTGSTFNPVYPLTPKQPKPGWDNFMSIGFTGATPSLALAPEYYINEIRVDWWPTTHICNSVSYVGIDGNPAVINASDFDASLVAKITRRPDASAGIRQTTDILMVFFKTEAFKSAPDVTKNVAISIDGNYTIRVYVNKTEVYSFQTASLRQRYNNPILLVNGFKYAYPPSARVYMDNLVLNNAAEVMY
jgi:hypothetical protein